MANKKISKKTVVTQFVLSKTQHGKVTAWARRRKISRAAAVRYLIDACL